MINFSEPLINIYSMNFQDGNIKVGFPTNVTPTPMETSFRYSETGTTRSLLLRLKIMHYPISSGL